MRRLTPILFCTALVLLVAACGGGGGSSNVSSDSVAVVGDQQISKADWDALMAQTQRNFAATKRKFPAAGTVALANLKTNATQFLIQSNEYQQEADKLGIKVTDKDIDARLAQIKKQYYGNPPGQPAASDAQMEQRYQAALKQQGFTDKEVRSGIKLQLIREKVFKKVTADAKVSDSDIKAYYDKNKARYAQPATPESRAVRHILVKKKALADSIYAQLQANPAQVRGARQEVLGRHVLEGQRRRASRGSDQGPNGAALRQGRLLDQDERGLQAGALAVRLAHHRGHRPDQAGPARQADPVRSGEGEHSPAAPLDEPERRDEQVARRGQEVVLQADRLPGGLRAASGPGSLQDQEEHDRRDRDHRVAPWPSARRCWSFSS